MIRHAAIFRLTHSKGSAADADFLTALSGLRAIPGVQDFAVSMQFATQADYTAYNDHPLHVAFVQTRWLPEVAAFMEHDTVPLTL